MRNPLSDKVVAIQPSGIRKFFDIVSEMPDAISLGVGEPDFDTPWHIRDEGIYALEKGRTFYTSNAGLKELREEIVRYLERRIHTSYNPADEVLITVGGSEGIDMAFRAMLNPGDEVLIPQPSYVSYEPCAVLADGVPVIIELKAENDFRLTKQELLSAITDKTKILVLPFPNNPTGAIMEKKDLEEIAEVCIEKDIYVLSDEIYSELSYKGDHVSIASLPGMRDRTILINGFSKAYAMTGWRRRFLMNAFREMGLSCFEPYGAFYTFPCIKEFGMTSDEFATRFLEEEKVAVVPGTAFGACGEGFLRISYAYSLEQLKEALGRLSHFVARLRAEKGAR